MLAQPMKKTPHPLSRKAVFSQPRPMVPSTIKTILVGTYKSDQLETWPGYYNYPLSAQDRFDKSSARHINELWLFQGAKMGRFFKAEFIGEFSRDALVKDFAYPAKGRPHGSSYLLFKIAPTTPCDSAPGRLQKFIVRAKDFKTSSVTARRIKAFLESSNRNDSPAAQCVPNIISRIPQEDLFVAESAIQPCLWPEFEEKPASAKDEVPKPLPAIQFFAPWIAPSSHCQKTSYPVVSLFSGAMGLDLGLEKAGMDIRIGQDYDKSCVETMRANNHPVMGGDIRVLSPELLLDAARLKVGEPFLVCGGPPCQPFSTAGKRLGINDPRGSLFMDFIRMIEAIRPRFFVMENVKGLMSAPLRTDEKGTMPASGTVLDVILAEFAKLNYKTVFGILDAVNYGVPQFRERFVLIGSRDAEDIFLPVPTHFQRHQNPAYRWRTLGDAIKDLENKPGVYHEFSPERAKFLKMVPPGGNWRSLPPDLLEEAMGGAYKSGGGKVGFYRRLSYAEPCPTVTTAPAQKATMLCHPTQLRTLSIAEYKRIQQFPDDWILTGSSADQYRQIGNAVPVGLAQAIGEALIATAFGTSAIPTKRFRGTGIHNRISQAITLGGTENNEE